MMAMAEDPKTLRHPSVRRCEAYRDKLACKFGRVKGKTNEAEWNTLGGDIEVDNTFIMNITYLLECLGECLVRDSPRSGLSSSPSKKGWDDVPPPGSVLMADRRQPIIRGFLTFVYRFVGAFKFYQRLDCVNGTLKNGGRDIDSPCL